jgi:threonine dehydratase
MEESMSVSDVAITLQDIYRAKRQINGLIVRTPLIKSPALGERTGGSVYLKAENLQKTGSFKIRGAANRILALTPEERAQGVVTVSTGNHGRAVAYVGRELGIRAVVCISGGVPGNKVTAIEQLGAEVMVHGETYDDAEKLAWRLRDEQGLTLVDPFDDPFVIAGQGTVGLELLEDCPEVDTAIVPLSGGGLMSGVALALKSANPSVRVVGVSMERGPAMVRCLEAGKLIQIAEEETLADALVGNVGLNNQHTFRMVQTYVDEVALVSEEEIAEAMAFVLAEHHLVVEGGGAVGIAALLSDKLGQVGGNVAIVVSGGNVGLSKLLQIAEKWSRMSR